MATIVGDDASKVIWGTNDASGDYIYGLGGNDTIEAGNGNDHLYGGLGNDKLYGQGGNDTLDGWNTGQGDDLLDGGWDLDTADYSGAPNPVIASLSTGRAKGADIGTDTLAWIENVTGGEAGDILIGDDPGFLQIGAWGHNVLDGRGGHDNLYGHGGNDTLYGGAGIDGLNGGDSDDQLYGQGDNDFLFGGPGSDTLDGGDGIDTASYASAAGGVWIGFDGMHDDGFYGDFLGSKLTEGVDTFVNVENISGSNSDDFIQGDALGVGTNNVLSGGNGDDWIYGDGPNTDPGGRGGNDALYGGNGADYLRGGMGVDVLNGGADADSFEFERLDTGVGAGNRDIVTDFQQNVDVLQISIFGEPLGFVGQSTFTGMDQVRYAFEGSNTIVQVNLDLDTTPRWKSSSRATST
jgi:Ca2+-binding RTX toxin-like protein